MPTFVKDTLDSPSGQLKGLINSVRTHFEYLEKLVEVKVQNEFNDKRFSELKRMFAHDRGLLDTCVKSIKMPYLREAVSTSLVCHILIFLKILRRK